MQRPILLLALCLTLLPFVCAADHLRFAPPRVYVAPTGDDSVACGNVTRSTPRRTLNGGNACLTPGGTLEIEGGTYDELLVGQMDSGVQCQSSLAAIQQPCTAVVGGTDPEHPTRLVAPGGPVIVSPRGKQFPGGGGIFTGFGATRHLHFEGLKLVKNAASGSAEGFVGGDAQYVTFTRGELDRGAFKSGVASQHFTVTHTYLHHAGDGVCPAGKPTPSQCSHGVYMCGQHHVFSDNTVEYASYYGVQFSCEQGGIQDIRIERNIVRFSAVVGIRCAGQGCLVASNLLVKNGQGMTLAGSGTVAHNTLAGYTPQGYNPDPWGIYSSGQYQIVDNIVTDQKSAFYSIANDQFSAPDTSKVHHNLCSASGNPACTIEGTAAEVYRDADQGDYSLKRTRNNPALGAGVPVAGVTTDIQGQPFHTETPSVGAYAAVTGTPEPQPPQPPGALVLECAGQVAAVPGAVTLTCTQGGGGRR